MGAAFGPSGERGGARASALAPASTRTAAIWPFTATSRLDTVMAVRTAATANATASGWTGHGLPAAGSAPARRAERRMSTDPTSKAVAQAVATTKLVRETVPIRTRMLMP